LGAPDYECYQLILICRAFGRQPKYTFASFSANTRDPLKVLHAMAGTSCYQHTNCVRYITARMLQGYMAMQ